MPLSPNMNLPIPVPSQTGGPQYALDEQSCFQQIDSHNHTPGQGIAIPLNALSINQNLDMSALSVTNLKSISFLNQAISPGSSSLYMLGNDLYWTDGSGAFNVQITSGNSVAVSGAVGFSGLPSGTASAAYLSLTGTFRFQSATNTGATLDVGPIKLRNTTVSSNAVTLTPPNPLPSNYSLTLPNALPASDSFVVSDNSGNLSFQSTSFVLPAGVMMMYGGTAAPTGWLFCDGSIVSQATYSNLFAIIGSSYNIGNEGAGNFRLPDLRSKSPVGAGQGDFVYEISGTASGNIALSSSLNSWTALQTGALVYVDNIVGITGLSPNFYYVVIGNPIFTSLGFATTRANAVLMITVPLGGSGSIRVTVPQNNYSLGDRGGEIRHALRLEETPVHDHGGSTGSSYVTYKERTAGAGFPGMAFGTTNGSVFIYPQLYGSDHTHSISSAGSSDAHFNLSPFLVVNYIIKY